MLQNKITITISLILLTLFCGVSVFSQDTEFDELSKNCECEQISDIEDIKLDLDFRDANLRDILSYISTKTGVTFVVDQKVRDLPTTINIKNISWKKAINGILTSNYLGANVECPIIRITGISQVKEYNACEVSVGKVDGQTLYTEFINFEESNLDAYDVITENKGGYKVIIDENGEFSAKFKGPSNLEKLLSKMLPNNPFFRGDETGRYLIVIESKNRLKLFEKFIEITKKLPKQKWRKGCFTLLSSAAIKAIKEREEDSRIVTERIKTKNIFSVVLNESNSKSQKN